MVDFDLETLEGAGVTIAIMSLATFAFMGFFIGMQYASTFINLGNKSVVSACSVITPGTYTIFPVYLSLIHSNDAYDALLTCLGKGVTPLSIAYWFAELFPLGAIVEFARQSFRNHVGE